MGATLGGKSKVQGQQISAGPLCLLHFKRGQDHFEKTLAKHEKTLKGLKKLMGSQYKMLLKFENFNSKK